MASIRGNKPSSRVFEFRAPGDSRTWITWATGLVEPRPRAGTKAAAWFSECQPRPCWDHVPAVWLPKQAARGVAMLRRRQARVEGLAVLSGQVYTGSGARKPVLGFPTIRAAARALRCSRRQIYRLAGLTRL